MRIDSSSDWDYNISKVIIRESKSNRLIGFISLDFPIIMFREILLDRLFNDLSTHLFLVFFSIKNLLSPGAFMPSEYNLHQTVALIVDANTQFVILFVQDELIR